LLNTASVCLLTRLGSPKYVGVVAVEVALGLGLADADADGEAGVEALADAGPLAEGLALELAAGTILAEVLAVLVALAEGDAVGVALAEGLALVDALALGETEGTGVPGVAL
jgi:hypothetical protein